jgi:galactonate dehydratase
VAQSTELTLPTRSEGYLQRISSKDTGATPNVLIPLIAIFLAAAIPSIAGPIELASAEFRGALAAGESLSSKQQVAELLRHEAADIINIEPLHMGGILGSRKVSDMIDAHYGTVIPHSAQGPMCTLACLHIDIATPNSWLQETFEDFNEPWERDLLTRFPRIVDGFFELPDAPGIGADLNVEEVKRHPYRSGYEPLRGRLAFSPLRVKIRH